MHKIDFFTAIAVVSLAAAAVGSELPPEVADRLENAISFDESNDFVGSYRISISTIVQKPNGKGREESLIEANVIHRGDGEIERTLLKYIEGGTDVTAKKRAKFENEEGGRDDDESDDLADPFGGAAARYRFSATESRGSMKVVTFEPAPGHEEDDDLARGTIAWDQANFEPRWLEMEALHPPTPLKELRMRIEFVAIDGDLFMSHLVTDGLAKILLFKREFHMEMRFDDISRGEKHAESAH